MKNLRTTVVCVCITLTSLGSYAQTNTTVPLNEPNQNKPKIFASLPETMPVASSKLAEVLQFQMGAQVSIDLGSLHFEGKVVSVAGNPEQNNSDIRSVVIRSSNYAGANLTISQVNLNGNISYTGRLIAMQAGDLIELQSRNGQYTLVKRKFYDLVNE